MAITKKKQISLLKQVIGEKRQSIEYEEGQLWLVQEGIFDKSDEEYYVKSIENTKRRLKTAEEKLKKLEGEK